MASRATKRRKRNAHDDPEAALRVSQLRVLIESVLCELHVTDEIALLLASESQWLGVRQAPPSVGIGVLTSDVAVRLFHTHSVRHSISTCNNIMQAFESSTELAAFCARVMEQTRRDQASRFAGITCVAMPDDAARTAGVHGDRILVYTRQFARARVLPTPLESRIGVLFRDDALVVVHKPHGMVSVDGNLCENDHTTRRVLSVQSLVREYYPDARMVHRLDQETSGILVVALTKSASQHLNQQFRDRSVNKTYFARVLGHVDGECGVIHARMAPSKTEKLVQRIVEEDEEGGAATRTEWRVIERSDSDAQEPPCTRMELKPVTGKTHQLRVHMEFLGHPILGDSLYSPQKVQELASRLLLHAAEIQFVHPVTNERITITCPCPCDF